MLIPTYRELTYEALCQKAQDLYQDHLPAHIHTTKTTCCLKPHARYAIILESLSEKQAYIYYDDAPIEQRAKPLAVLLHGSESVPEDTESLRAPSPYVATRLERMAAGFGHFHVLPPDCLCNSHPGQWTVVFEDEEQGVTERVSTERPLSDIRAIERSVYALE